MSATQRGRVLSCIQPTSDIHVGNYFGAVANWVALQHSHECIYGVVDLHAMTMPYQPCQLRRNTERMVIDLISCGIDPERCTLFVQSLVPEHTELCWVLGCLTPIGNLSRMTQFKEKGDSLRNRNSESSVSAGLFNYPVLQAADILLYKASQVPVGRDQEQHLELARDLARRFNRHVGSYFFPEPAPLYTSTPKIMSLADPSKKMSKSLGERHYIGLFEGEETIRSKVRAAVTDSGVPPEGASISPGVANLLEILSACGQDSLSATMLEDYDARRLQYRHLKQAVADALVGLTRKLRQSREEVIRDSGSNLDMAAISEKARRIACEVLAEVRELVGLPARGTARPIAKIA